MKITLNKIISKHAIYDRSRCKQASILVIFILIVSSVYGQNDPSSKLMGRIVDQTSQLPLKGVDVVIDGTLQSTLTDNNGVFVLVITELPTVIKCYQSSFEEQFIIIEELIADTLVIALIPKATVLEEFVVTERKVEAITKKGNSVLDYEFSNQGILLITFRYDLSQSSLVLLNSNFDTLSSTRIPEKPLRLFKDCLGNNHIVSKDNLYQIYFDSKELVLFPPVKRELFEKKLFPCVASDNQRLYFIEKQGTKEVQLNRFSVQTHNYALAYFSLNRKDKKRNELISIVDETTARLSADEQSYIDGKEANGFYRSGDMKDFDRIFSEKTLFKEIFTPLYIIQDTVYVFDFINKKIHRFAKEKKMVELGMKFHNDDKSWSREIFVDGKKNKVFSMYEINGKRELREVDLKNGNLVKTHAIPFQFVEKQCVNDGYVYFLFKEMGSDFKVLSRYKLEN